MPGPLELLVEPEAQRLLDGFSRLFGVRIAIFDPAWRELGSGERRGSCAFCTLLRNRLGQDAACLAEDARRRVEAVERGRMIAYRCHAGLDEALLPLSEDGRVVGWIMIGQFRTAARIPARLLGKPWARGHQATLRRTYLATPQLTRARRADLLVFLTLLVNAISARRLVRQRRDPLIESLLSTTPGRTLTLAGAARLTGLGRSTLAARIRSALGCGLRQAQIRARLDQAERFLGQGLGVAAAARRAGFSDPAYFSRLFRRHRGRPPSRLSAPRAPDCAAR